MKSYRNVFDAIRRDGHDEYFTPRHLRSFKPTSAAPGSRAKLDQLRDRVTLGLPLWHDADRRDYHELVAAVPPRYF
jgi:hypothetical protein